LEIIFLSTALRIITVCDVLTFQELCCPFEMSHHLLHFTHGHTMHTDFGSNKTLLRLYDTRRAGKNICFTPRKSNIQKSAIENMDNLPLFLD